MIIKNSIIYSINIDYHFEYIQWGGRMTLWDSEPGMTVRIDSVGESKLKNRLMTMGLIPGTRVEILRSAPMGDPIAIRLRSYNLAMRKDDAAQIQVSLSS